MQNELTNLSATLNLEAIEHDLYRGTSPQVGWQRVFGGHVIAQALAAAMRTVDKARIVHSLHGYFIRPGDPSIPIIYQIERDRDGGSFSSRRIVATQHGASIFTMSASFQIAQDGFEHQIAMPDIAKPEDLPSEESILNKYAAIMPENMQRYFTRERPIELRMVNPDHLLNPVVGEPIQNIWFRANGELNDDLTLHQCILAYASDMTLIDTALLPQGRNLFDPQLILASLDHAIWFHRPFRMDDWLLYAQDSATTQGGRALTHGNIFTSKGELVASVTQEGMVRERKAK